MADSDRGPRVPIVELAGLPAAGKTTTARLIEEALTRQRIPVRVVPEAASIAPIGALKRHWFFNAWTLCTSVKEYLEASAAGDAAKVVFDRGFVDCLCWVMWYRTTGRIDEATARALEGFATAAAWFESTEVTVVLRCEFETALKRRGEGGRIVNAKTFQELRRAYDLVLNRLVKLDKGPMILMIDTDSLTPEHVRDRVLTQIGRSD